VVTSPVRVLTGHVWQLSDLLDQALFDSGYIDIMLSRYQTAHRAFVADGACDHACIYLGYTDNAMLFEEGIKAHHSLLIAIDTGEMAHYHAPGIDFATLIVVA
jgi:hypothetical protein